MVSLRAERLGIARFLAPASFRSRGHGAAVSGLAAGRPELALVPLSPPNRDLRLGLEDTPSGGIFVKETLRNLVF